MNHILQIDFLLIQFVISCSNSLLYSLYFFSNYIVLYLYRKSIIPFINFIFYCVVDIQPIRRFCCVNWQLLFVDLGCKLLTNIDEVTYILVATEATKAVFLNLFPGCWKNFMIINAPPHFLISVKHIAVVMAILSKSIVDQDTMKKVWSFPFFGKRMSNNLFK